MSDKSDERALQEPRWTVLYNIASKENPMWVGTAREFFDMEADAAACYERQIAAGNCPTKRPYFRAVDAPHLGAAHVAQRKAVLATTPAEPPDGDPAYIEQLRKALGGVPDGSAESLARWLEFHSAVFGRSSFSRQLKRSADMLRVLSAPPSGEVAALIERIIHAKQYSSAHVELIALLDDAIRTLARLSAPVPDKENEIRHALL